jgi:hypothetical protein
MTRFAVPLLPVPSRHTRPILDGALPPHRSGYRQPQNCDLFLLATLRTGEYAGLGVLSTFLFPLFPSGALVMRTRTFLPFIGASGVPALLRFNNSCAGRRRVLKPAVPAHSFMGTVDSGQGKRSTVDIPPAHSLRIAGEIVGIRVPSIWPRLSRVPRCQSWATSSPVAGRFLLSELWSFASCSPLGSTHAFS